MAKRTTKKRTTTKKRVTKKRTAGRTTSRKKTPARRTTTKKTTARGASAEAPPAAQGKPLRVTGADKPRSKAEVYSLLADYAGVSKKEVGYIFDGMSQIIKKDLAKQGPGEFKVPGMMKITVQRKPAQKARKGINPFTGEETVFKAKPARNVVKVRPLKGLKELV
jgi:nucleoid DNA-binding protein